VVTLALGATAIGQSLVTVLNVFGHLAPALSTSLFAALLGETRFDEPPAKALTPSQHVEPPRSSRVDRSSDAVAIGRMHLSMPAGSAPGPTARAGRARVGSLISRASR
jgi:hypothetical protein